MWHISELHEHVHGVPRMLGLLHCMHVHWKNCPIAYQGLYLGKEKYTVIILEAVADNNLWFWHAAFGFAGSCNNISILDVSLLHTCFLDGSDGRIDFDYSIGEFKFNKLFIGLMVSILSLLDLSKLFQFH